MGANLYLDADWDNALQHEGIELVGILGGRIANNGAPDGVEGFHALFPVGFYGLGQDTY